MPEIKLELKEVDVTQVLFGEMIQKDFRYNILRRKINHDRLKSV